MKFLSAFILLLLMSCKSTKKIPFVELIEFEYASYNVNYGGCIGSDSLQLRTVDNDLYKDQHDQLYYLCYDRSDETGETISPLFIRRFPNACVGDKDSSYDLSKTIDLATFDAIGNGYYKDEKNTYRFIPAADGGQFKIAYNDLSIYENLGKGFYQGTDDEIYIKTQVLKNVKEDRWSDFFYRMVPRIDVNTYEDFGQLDAYAKDKNNVCWRRTTTDGEFIEIIKKADAASFVVLEARSLAKDKNYVYDQYTIVKGVPPDSINTQADLVQYLQLHR